MAKVLPSLRGSFFVFSLLLASIPLPLAAQPAPASETPANIVLTGSVKGPQNHSYVEVPFRVPGGVQRVTLTFHYTEREQHTALDLGLEDPQQLRCWSGGNKSTLTIGLSDATPSCLPGPLPAGTWHVLIGVPNIRAGVTSQYTAKVYFTRSGLVAAGPDFLRAPLRSGPAWYRGDLHMHTGHSDGQCPSQTGRKVPCPVFFTVQAAARRGLDFIAITDHNATSQYDTMRELQPYFDKVLLVPGREITTFYGHMNLLGTTSYIDFRVGSTTVPNIDTFLRRARQLGALVSINHPDSPSGEQCMGCGWTPTSPVDWNLLAAVEAVNGGSESRGENELPFWNQQLDRGHRLTGIGGSDNHNAFAPPDEPSAVGSPTTVVYAANLSVPAVLDGIRAGHVFIDITGSHDRMLTMTAVAPSGKAQMGDVLDIPKGEQVEFNLHTANTEQGKASLLEDGHPMSGLAARTISATSGDYRITWTSDGTRHWFRPQIDGPDGKLWLLGNPVYVNWARRPQ